MSLNKSSTRLSLLAGSSLIMAGLLCGGGFVVLPSIAQAAENPCGTDPDTNLGAADSISCPAGAYPTGIQHTSNGDLTVSVAKGANPGTGGVATEAGQAADNIAVTITGTGNFSGNSIPSPVMFDLESQQGNVTFNMAVGNLQAGNAATTHAIRAISHDGGDVTVTLNAGGAFAGGVAGQAGIEARSYGGGDVTISATNAPQSRLYGILASTDGTGALTINAGGSITSGGAAPVAGIHATTGTGLLTINTAGSSGLGGSAIRTVAGGNAIINVNGGVLNSDGGVSSGGGGMTVASGVTNWTIDSATVAGSLTTINVNGVLVSAPTPSDPRSDHRTLRATGGGNVVVNVSGLLGGAVNFAGLTGAGDGARINIADNAIWRLAGDQALFSGRDDVVDIALGGALQIQVGSENDGNGIGTLSGIDAVTANFGAGSNDRLVNAGNIVIGPTWTRQNIDWTDRDRLEAEVNILNLETFENSGAILFGEYVFGRTMDTDGTADDMLLLPGATFIGSGDSLLIMDVDLNGGQTSCTAAARDSVTLSLAADCIGVPGGATEGVTRVRLLETTAGDRGAYRPEGIVLVDVSGGTGAQGDFIVDPTSDNYSPAFGGVIDKGSFIYPLLWDADNQQHKLASMVSGSSLQYPLLAQAAHEVWRLATGTWLDRQADLRGGDREGVGGGVWVRASGQTAERDLMQSSEAVGVTYDFDNTYRQDSYAVTIGLDVLSGSSGDTAYGIGVMGGYASSRIDFETSPNRAQFDGWSLGGYTSFISGGLFVDAALNGAKLIMDHDVPALNLFPVGTVTSTNLASVGGQVEAGWRFPVMGTAFIEPLAGVTYVRSKFDELRIVPDDASRAGVDVEFDDPASLRANIGGRLGLDQDYGGWRAQYSVLGRVWNEFEDETNVVLMNLGDDAFASNAFSGQFTEVGVGVSLYGLAGAASGFLNLGGMFGDDYQSTKASAGVRVNW